MILEFSPDLDELLEKIQETSDLLKGMDAVPRALVLGVLLSNTLQDDFEEEVDVSYIMERADRIAGSLKELQVEGVRPSSGASSN